MADRSIRPPHGLRARLMGNLVSTEWLAMRLASPDVVIIDASWHLPATKRSARAEFVEIHIPGAQFYDLDAGSAPDTTLPHMLPSAEKFAGDMKALGVGTDTSVVVYDSAGLFSAARLWWMLHTFGHHDVTVLDGGLPKWLKEGRPLDRGQALPTQERPFAAQLDRSRVALIGHVAAALSSKNVQVVDARSGSRFRGEEVEARPGVRSGHMPGAQNVHYASLLQADGTLKGGAALLEVFESAGIDLNRPVITSCGSGVTAAMLMLGLTQLGVKDTKLYDGSWTEWGASNQDVAIG
jgi:thiosulfate/3-mercaptopyruvate sulfurtransferase